MNDRWCCGSNQSFSLNDRSFLDSWRFHRNSNSINSTQLFALYWIHEQLPGCASNSISKEMVLTNFNGVGIGFGFGVGCGFGVGWGFGGMPVNFLGLGAGGGCGVGLGLGWGFGTAFGSQYRSSRVTFEGIEFIKKAEGNGSESKDLLKSTKEVRASQ